MYHMKLKKRIFSILCNLSLVVSILFPNYMSIASPDRISSQERKSPAKSKKNSAPKCIKSKGEFKPSCENGEFVCPDNSFKKVCSKSSKSNKKLKPFCVNNRGEKRLGRCNPNATFIPDAIPTPIPESTAIPTIPSTDSKPILPTIVSDTSSITVPTPTFTPTPIVSPIPEVTSSECGYSVGQACCPGDRCKVVGLICRNGFCEAEVISGGSTEEKRIEVGIPQSLPTNLVKTIDSENHESLTVTTVNENPLPSISLPLINVFNNFLEIKATENAKPPYTISVNYSGAKLSSSSNSTNYSYDDIRLYHGTNGNWVDVTTSTNNFILTGVVDSLSPFVLGIDPTAPPAGLLPTKPCGTIGLQCCSFPIVKPCFSGVCSDGVCSSPTTTTGGPICRINGATCGDGSDCCSGHCTATPVHRVGVCATSSESLAACGANGQACCSSDPVCNSSRLNCVPSSMVCINCGGDGQGCCATGTPCDSGFTCDPTLMACSADCGGDGEACCPTGHPCVSGLTCNSSMVCAMDATCGLHGLPCCNSGRACDNDRLVCTASMTCINCGGDGGACCTTGTPCNVGFECDPVLMACSADCGLDGEVCCPTGYPCVSGLTCNSSMVCGMGVTCGLHGQPCCSSDPVCSSSRLNCVPSSMVCLNCGGDGQGCCAAGTPCDSGFVCDPTLMACASITSFTSPVCGNGTCDSGENVTSCPGDCSSSITSTGGNLASCCSCTTDGIAECGSGLAVDPASVSCFGDNPVSAFGTDFLTPLPNCGTSLPPNPIGLCASDTDCPSGEKCVASVCTPIEMPYIDPSITPMCEDVNCPEGYYCTAGVCVLNPADEIPYTDPTSLVPKIEEPSSPPYMDPASVVP